MKLPCSGIILAGGLNTRFSGINKAFFRIGKKSIFDRVYGIFNDLFKETILVTNDPLSFLEWDIQIVTDIYQVQSPLTGIHAGLFFMTNPYAFIAACDIPFLKKGLVETIVDGIEPHFDVIIPETTEGLQPLCAIYSKQCLKILEPHLAEQERKPGNGKILQKELKIQYLFRKLRVKKLSENILREIDPDLISFFNINTPEDLDRAKEMVR